jgi:hypothetical protein
MKYNWKIPSFAKGIDPELAVKEFELIEETYGAITAENILKRASDTSSPLHELFEWNDTEAAIAYRKHQARQILNNIQVNVISDGEPKRIDVYEVVVRNNERQYKHVQDFTVQDVINLKNKILKDLTAIQNKMSFYAQFKTAIPKIEELTTLLQAV